MSGMPARPDPPAPHRLGMAEGNRRPGPGGTRPAPLDVLVVAGPLDEDSHDVGGALPAVSPRRRAARLHAFPATRRQADGCAAGGRPCRANHSRVSLPPSVVKTSSSSVSPPPPRFSARRACSPG